MGTRARPMRSPLLGVLMVVLVMVPAALAMAPGKSAPPTPPTIAVGLTLDRVTLGPDDTLAVDAFVRNAGTDDVYVFGVLDWGFHGGLTLQVRNASGEPVEIPGGDHAPILAPSLARDRTRYVRLAPGHFLGCTRSLPAGALLGAPGQYTVRVVYFAPIIEEWCPRRPCWSMDGGPVASPWIPVEVRGATESR